jgi:hypothetical protein
MPQEGPLLRRLLLNRLRRKRLHQHKLRPRNRQHQSPPQRRVALA